MTTAALFPQIPDLYITEELARRPAGETDWRGEMIAVQELAVLMASDPDALMPRFVDAAMHMVGGVTAGVSVFEPTPDPGQFRWRWVRGEFMRFDGAPTPRNFSPCGVTLDRGEVTLTKHPERAYGWIRDAGVVCPEVLLAPLSVRGGPDLGTMWIVAPKAGHFTADHARAIGNLSVFVAAALRMTTAEQDLRAALGEQALLASEMAHRTKNLFAVAEGMIRATARDVQSVPDFARALTGRLHALADANALISRDLDKAGRIPRGTTLATLLATVLAPYNAESDTVTLLGPQVSLGDHAINSLALVFHELATNSAKYGSLSNVEGKVEVTWGVDEENLSVEWVERGGPAVAGEPEQAGFGSNLLLTAVQRQLDGKLDRTWRPKGLAVSLRVNRKRITA